LDFSAVLVTVKAESISDVLFNLTVKNHCSTGTIGQITIIDFEDLASGSEPSSGHDLDSIPQAFSSDEEFVELQGGCGFADVLQAIGAPAPLVPHGEPSAAAPATSLVSRAHANAPPLPLVAGSHVLSKPLTVSVKLHLGYFNVSVLGTKGECLFFRMPLRRAAEDLGSKGLLVANLTTASVGIINSIALVGLLRRPTLTVDVLARNAVTCSDMDVPFFRCQCHALG
jgi:hypothetical protein